MSHTPPTPEANIIAIVKAQRAYFKSGATRSYQSRFASLHKLKAALQQYEAELMDALHKDLGKPEFEAYVSEVGFSLHDVSHTLSSLKSWMKPKWTLTSLLAQPATSRIYYEPLGVNLIIAPYNYPINLTFSPLIAALAAGNTAVIKTSELTPHCSAVVRQLIEATFPPELVAYIEGAVPETTVLLQQKFDHIFFTGSPRVGSIVMSAAAKHLTPVTLELGGKSPCIVHEDAKLDIAVNRIVSGKFMNAGQTCIAPDYVLVHEAVKEDFLARLKARILAVYGDNPIASPDFGRIISDSHFQRISGMIDPDKLLVGGQTDAPSRFIAPTVLRDVTLTDKAMSEEIFGPVLPVLSYQSLEDIHHIIEQLPQHPLACYVFSESTEFQQTIINSVQFGGGCINNCLLHTANHHLPFGGVGESGIGAYHGKHGFERFSHQKPVLKSATWLDASLVYAPYGDKINWLRRFLK